MLTMSCRSKRPSPFRQLAISRVIEEVEKCLVDEAGMGVVWLAAWFEGDGREWLDMAGMGHLAKQSAAELAQLAFRYGPDALDKSRRCYNCKWLDGENGRVKCALDRWTTRGWAAEYARSTVRHEGRGEKFRACSVFEGRDNGDG